LRVGIEEEQHGADVVVPRPVAPGRHCLRPGRGRAVPRADRAGGEAVTATPLTEQLKLLIRAGHPLVSIETRDEGRAVELVRKTAENHHLPLFEWSATTGMCQTKPSRADTKIKA